MRLIFIIDGDLLEILGFIYIAAVQTAHVIHAIPSSDGLG